MNVLASTGRSNVTVKPLTVVPATGPIVLEMIRGPYSYVACADSIVWWVVVVGLVCSAS